MAINSVGFIVNRGPMARGTESHAISKVGAYGGRPECVDVDGSCCEVWITLDYGDNKGLYLRLDKETAIRLNQKISELLAPDPLRA